MTYTVLKVNSEPFSVVWRRSGSLLECDVNASRERTNDGRRKEIRKGSCKGGDLRYCAIRRSLTNRAAFIATSTCNLSVEVWFNAKTFQLLFRYFKIHGKSFINSTCTQMYIHVYCIYTYETYEIEAEVNGTFAVFSDYQVTTNTKATVLDIRRKNFSRNLLRFFYYNLSYVTSNVLRFPPGAACSSTVSWLSRVSRTSRLWKETVISLTVTWLKKETENKRARRRETDVWMERRGYEGIQFPSSRGWRAAHTLPFGAVTPRELWSPNEWLGRAKRRITYFFFFFFFFSRSCTLFQDVYKYENRTCLLTGSLTTWKRPWTLSCWMLLRHPYRARTGRSATWRRSISGSLCVVHRLTLITKLICLNAFYVASMKLETVSEYF